jgi:hypothetical protein
VGNNVTTKIKNIEELDVEWMQLIVEALEMGIDKGDIQEFLKQNKM